MQLLTNLAVALTFLGANAFPIRGQRGFVEFELHKVENYGIDPVKSIGSSHGRIIDVNLANKQFYYQIQLGIGNPSQLINFTIDTGSSDLWVMAANNPWCTTDPFNSTGIDCTGSVFYPNASRTFQTSNDSFAIEYGDGTFANGTMASDTVRIGDAAILNATFAMASDVNSSTCVFGIGFIGNEANAQVHRNGSGVYPTYFNIPTLMKQQNLISTNAYSLWLNDKDATEGSILFGGVDRTKYEGDLVVMPVYNNYYEFTDRPTQTRVMLNGISIDNTLLAEFSIAVLLDSGTSYAYLPEPIVRVIGEALGFTYDDTLGYYYGSIESAMSNGKTLELNFSGAEINVPISDLLVDLTLDDQTTPLLIDGQPQAILAIGVADSDYLYILGDVFLRSMYAVFDIDHYEIALANARMNVTEKDIVTIGASIPGAKQAPQYANTFPNNSSFAIHPRTPTVSVSSTLIPAQVTATNNSTAESTTVSSSTLAVTSLWPSGSVQPIPVFSSGASASFETSAASSSSTSMPTQSASPDTDGDSDEWVLTPDGELVPIWQYEQAYWPKKARQGNNKPCASASFRDRKPANHRPPPPPPPRQQPPCANDESACCDNKNSKGGFFHHLLGHWGH